MKFNLWPFSFNLKGLRYFIEVADVRGTPYTFKIEHLLVILLPGYLHF